jgi:putative transcriptional regulator
MKKTAMKTTSRRKTNVDSQRIGKAILADLTEFADALESGVTLDSKYTMHRVEVPDPPAKYTAQAVRATRDKVGVSQSVFAHLLGVSTVLMQAWEQGNRVPAAWARRLLDEVNHDPNRWRGMVRRAS